MALLIRYLLGGMGFYSAAVVIIITGIALCILSKYYLKMNLKQKLLLSVTLLVTGITISKHWNRFLSGTFNRLVSLEFYIINILGLIISMIFGKEFVHTLFYCKT